VLHWYGGVFFSSFFFFRDITLPIARNVCDYIGIVMENVTKPTPMNKQSGLTSSKARKMGDV
jgi:hypothetical protein